MTFTFGDAFTQAFQLEKERNARSKERLEARKIQEQQLENERERIRIANRAADVAAQREARLVEEGRVRGSINALNLRAAERQEASATAPLTQQEIDHAQKNFGIDISGLSRTHAGNLTKQALEVKKLNTQLRVAQTYRSQQGNRKEIESVARTLTAEELARDIIELRRQLGTKAFKESATQTAGNTNTIRILMQQKNFDPKVLDSLLTSGEDEQLSTPEIGVNQELIDNLDGKDPVNEKANALRNAFGSNPKAVDNFFKELQQKQ